MVKKKDTHHEHEESDEPIEVVQEMPDTQQQELTVQLQRALADYQNLQRRVEEERHALSRFANQVLLLELLPIFEHLQQIVAFAPEAEKQSSWFAPLAMTVSQLQDVFKHEGVEEINPIGEMFNPNEHEAVDTVAGDEDNKVVTVLSRGYILRDKVIKEARVTVSKRLTNSETTED